MAHPGGGSRTLHPYISVVMVAVRGAPVHWPCRFEPRCGGSVEAGRAVARRRWHSGRPRHGNGCNLFESTMFWVVLFGLPVLAIVVIILLAAYQASGVQKDGRDDKPED